MLQLHLLSLGATAYGGTISKSNINDLVIDSITDFKLTPLTIDENADIIIGTTLSTPLPNGFTVSGITMSGTYYIYFDIEDTIGIKVNSDVNVELNIDI